jgi:hypothetical protein
VGRGYSKRRNGFGQAGTAEGDVEDAVLAVLVSVLLCGDDADLCGGTGGGVRRFAVGLCFI